jgi:hypothetical protein
MAPMDTSVTVVFIFIFFHELWSLGGSYVEYGWGREEKSPKPSW